MRFKNFYSNTILGSGNNNLLVLPDSTSRCGIKLVKPRIYGRQRYTFVYSNTVDSTFDSGSTAYANLPGESWTIESLSVADAGEKELFKVDFEGTRLTTSYPVEKLFRLSGYKEILFGGENRKILAPNEIVFSDSTEIEILPGHLLALKIKFSGSRIPYTSDKIVPCFTYNNGEYKYSREFPQPVFFGTVQEDRKTRLAFLGDSITQGLGTATGQYEFWTAKIADKLPPERYAVWNLGLGFGRAEDAAECGCWLDRAKQNDIVFVCFGVNDILQYGDSQRICAALSIIVSELKKAGVKTGIFTIPPFDFEGKQAEVYDKCNKYIRDILSKETDFFFDIAEVLAASNNKYSAPHGGHPDKFGCSLVADAFLKKFNNYNF